MQFDEPNQKIFDLKSGEKIGDLMKNFTICPLRNASCSSYVKLEFFGYGMSLLSGYEAGTKEIWLCPWGVGPTGEECKLNK